MQISDLIEKLQEQEILGITKVVFHIVDPHGNHYEEREFQDIGCIGDNVTELIITL